MLKEEFKMLDKWVELKKLVENEIEGLKKEDKVYQSETMKNIETGQLQALIVVKNSMNNLEGITPFLRQRSYIFHIPYII